MTRGPRPINKERTVSSINGTGKTKYHKRKNEVDPCLIPYIKINSKLINDLNLRANIIRFLEENVRENFYGLGFGNGFLNITPKAQATQEKADK